MCFIVGEQTCEHRDIEDTAISAFSSVRGRQLKITNRKIVCHCWGTNIYHTKITEKGGRIHKESVEQKYAKVMHRRRAQYISKKSKREREREQSEMRTVSKKGQTEEILITSGTNSNREGLSS
jgi:hypothetical protein